MDPHPEPVASRTMTRRGRDRTCYDYRDTPISSLIWCKLLLQKKRNKIQIYEPSEYIIGGVETIVDKGKEKIDMDDMQKERYYLNF